MTKTIQIKRWKISPMKRVEFYPITKFIGQVVEDGKVIAETGKCATADAARRNARKLMGA